MKSDKQRTQKQNKATWLYCQMMADALNENGLDMVAVLKPGTHIPWTKDSVMNFMWRPIQEIMLDQESTTEMETHEPSIVYDVINRKISSQHGIYVPFPDKRG